MNKRENRFEAYQQAKLQSREKLITDYLRYLKTTRVRFTYVTDLAAMVATHIAQKENGKCNKATLLRNKKYKALLLTFMASHLGGGTQNINELTVTDEKAKALLTTAQLDAANLRREVERLKAYISILEQGASEKNTAAIGQSDTPQLTNDLKENQLKYVRTCQALHAVLRHLESSISVDPARKAIIDLSRLRKNVIVDADLASPFIDWLNANQGIG
jgi:hypothetical protein